MSLPIVPLATMDLWVLSVVISLTAAAQLQNNYLPPAGAGHAGGSPGALSTPFGAGISGGTGGGFGEIGGKVGGTGSGSAFATHTSGGKEGIPASTSGGSSGGDGGHVIPIVSQTNEPNKGDGSYSFSYESGNSIKVQEQGAQQEAEQGPGSAVQGSFSYDGPDGQLITITYTADVNGYQPHGDHLPTAPPIPPEILQSLEQNAAEEAAGGGQGKAAAGGLSGGSEHSGAEGHSGGVGVVRNSGVGGGYSGGGGGGGGAGGDSGYNYPRPGK